MGMRNVSHKKRAFIRGRGKNHGTQEKRRLSPPPQVREKRRSTCVPQAELRGQKIYERRIGKKLDETFNDVCMEKEGEEKKSDIQGAVNFCSWDRGCKKGGTARIDECGGAEARRKAGSFAKKENSRHCAKRG